MAIEETPAAAAEPAREERTLTGLMRYFGRLGVLGFGGPIALVGYMHRDLVEQRGWYTENEYQQGLAFAELTPGPLAAHLAMWFGLLGAVRRHTSDVGRLLEVDESGGEARTYHLEGDFLKTQRPHRLRPRTSLAKEELFLRTLEREGEFPVPRVLGYGHVDGIEYLCLTRMPGTAMLHLDLNAALRAAALEDLGRTLRRIHQLDQSTFASSELMPGDAAPSDLRARFADTFDRVATALEESHACDGALDVRAISAARLAVTPADANPVALHSNPGPEHTFADADSGRYTGLIDFGDAYRSHPALDLRRWADAGDADHLLAGYQSLGPLPESFDQVRRTGLLLMALARAARGVRTVEDTVVRVE